ncbi:PH domain-containing protein [Kordiimonas sp. SCSIO 12610]|uniref:PH domain-containing protein n=1 Tax=Kordiimonas sp. SCSIO 12610 TaxID=2829597 RepID=UPI00210A3A3B|nr:PH domain-containing protein [Kordiimonas sp. SCSIO 12610]UTW54571.1 PH domain-containing protein [Kordiimonas sp. SCSIO 12610]
MTEHHSHNTDPVSDTKNNNKHPRNWQRLSPVAIAYFVVTTIKQTAQHGWQALAPLFVLIASKGFDLWWFTIAGAALVAAIIIVAILKYLYFRFNMTDTSFLIRSGVISKKQLNLSFGRIQNIAIKQPIYFRPFGLSVLTLESAGSSSEEVNLAGIPIELANSVKHDVIQKQTNIQPDDGTDSNYAEASQNNEKPIVTQDIKSLIKHGVSNNNIWIFAGLAAPILNQFEDNWDWLVTPQMQAAYERVEALGPVALIGSTIILAFAVLCILMLISVAASILIHYDYKLFRNNGRISRQNGLLEKQQANMEESKIQRLVIKQSAIGRLVGCFNIVFKQIGFIRNAAQGGKNFIIPSLDIKGYKYVSELLYDGLNWKEIKTLPINSMYTRRLILVAAIPILIGAGLLSIKAGAFSFLLLLILAPLSLIFTQKKKRYRYALHGEYAIIQSGFIGKSISVFPMYKVQNVRIRQSPGQRRKGLATLKINIAGQTLTMPYMPLNDANHWRNLILAKVEQSTKPWM